jgi:tetratricopeptide repeat protein
MKILKTLLVISLLYCVSVILLVFAEKIDFGWGLGGLGHLYLHILWVALIIVTIVFVSRKQKRSNTLLSIMISAITIICLFFSIRSFTVDRGPEDPWDGRIFRYSFSEWQEIKKEKINNKLDSLDKKILHFPNDYKAITEKGNLLYDKDSLDLAFEEYRKAIKIDSNYFDALYGIGNCYCQYGMYEDALKALEKAYSIDSTKKENLSTRIRNIKSIKLR